MCSAKPRTDAEEIFGYRIWLPCFPFAIRFSFPFFPVGFCRQNHTELTVENRSALLFLNLYNFNLQGAIT
jgi:hypothetical protein